jgi:hypothetical protein
MEENQGVMEGGEVDAGAPEGAPVDAAPAESASPADEGQQQETAEQDVEVEKLPFGKHPRWQSMVSSNKELKQQVAQFQQQMKSLEGAAAVQRWLQEDPRGLKAWLETQLAGKEEPKDPYADFDPTAAEVLRKAESAAERLERMEKQWHEEAITQNRQSIDGEFDRLAQEAGYLDAKGTGNENFMRLLATATWTEMQAIAKNPDLPTKAELHEAFTVVKQGLQAAQTMGAKKVVAKPTVPASGSNRGSIPAGKTERTDNERIADIVHMLG